MNLIRNLSLSRRLLVGFGLVLSLLALTTLLSVFTMRDTRARLTVVSEELSPIVALVSQMKEQANQAAVSMSNFALLNNGEELKQEFGRLAGAYKTYETLAKELSERVGRSRIAPEEEMALVKKMAAAQLAATAVFEGAKSKAGPSGTVEDMAVLVRIELRTNMAPWGKAQTAWLAAITEMEQHQAQTIQTYQAAVVQQVTRGQLVALVVAAAALVAGLVASLTITRSVVRPVGEAMQVADRMAEGDLSQPIAISHRDELGQLQQRLEAMRLRWAETLLQLRHATDGVGTASTEIAAGNHDLSQRTEHAASRLQEVTASMHTLTLNVQQSADAAREADQLAGSAAQVAERGGEVVSRVVAAMTEIDASAQRIAEIISVIDGIAFQTNILALNAAVEAARAGEHGRGFAVVAGEVRALAQRAAVAAKEIKSLIGTSVEQVQSGSRHVEEAGSTMRDIVGSVQRVTQIIGDIAEAAKAQSQGISHVNGSVVHLDQSTQQNAALVEQSAAASESLKEQAQRLTEAIRAFKVA